LCVPEAGVLSQDQFAFDAFRAEYCDLGTSACGSALQEHRSNFEKPEMTDEDGMKLGELESIVGEEDGYTVHRRRAAAARVDITDDLPAPDGELQGGQKVRVLLAQRCSDIRSPAARRTYEPFDLDSIHWLQGFMNQYDASVIVIRLSPLPEQRCTHIADTTTRPSSPTRFL